MKRPVYCIRDRKGEFWTPSVDQNDDSAIRNFAYMINSGENIMNYCPADFELYRIGEFDAETGRLSPLDMPKLLLSGDEIEWRKDK